MAYELYHTLQRGSALRRDARSMRRGDGVEGKAGRRARTILPVNCDPHRSLSLPIMRRSASSDALRWFNNLFASWFR